MIDYDELKSQPLANLYEMYGLHGIYSDDDQKFIAYTIADKEMRARYRIPLDIIFNRTDNAGRDIHNNLTDYVAKHGKFNEKLADDLYNHYLKTRGSQVPTMAKYILIGILIALAVFLVVTIPGMIIALIISIPGYRAGRINGYDVLFNTLLGWIYVIMRLTGGPE